MKYVKALTVLLVLTGLVWALQDNEVSTTSGALILNSSTGAVITAAGTIFDSPLIYQGSRTLNQTIIDLRDTTTYTPYSYIIPNYINTTQAGAYELKTHAAASYVNRSSWVTIDNYPTPCSGSLYTQGLGDTLTCTDVNDTIDDRIASITYLPSAVATIYGTYRSGDVDSLNAVDDNVYNVSEAGGANPLTVNITYTGVVDFNQIQMMEKYKGGSGHEVLVEMYDFNTASWEEYYEITDQNSLVGSVIPVLDTSDHISGGEVRVRFRHVNTGITSHYLEIDYIALVNGITGTALISAEHDSLSGRESFYTNHPDYASNLTDHQTRIGAIESDYLTSADVATQPNIDWTNITSGIPASVLAEKPSISWLNITSDRPEPCGIGQFVKGFNWPNFECDSDVDTTYTAGGTLLKLVGTEFQVFNGTLTNTYVCTYATANGLVCNTDPATLVNGATQPNIAVANITVGGSTNVNIGTSLDMVARNFNASTGFNVGGSVYADGQITDDGDIVLDPAGILYVNPNGISGGGFEFSDGNNIPTLRFKNTGAAGWSYIFNNRNDTTLFLNGGSEKLAGGQIEIDGINEAGSVIRFKTGSGVVGSIADSNDYIEWSTKADIPAMTAIGADFLMNITGGDMYIRDDGGQMAFYVSSGSTASDPIIRLQENGVTKWHIVGEESDDSLRIQNNSESVKFSMSQSGVVTFSPDGESLTISDGGASPLVGTGSSTEILFSDNLNPNADSTLKVGETGQVWLEGWFDNIKTDNQFTMTVPDIILQATTDDIYFEAADKIIFLPDGVSVNDDIRLDGSTGGTRLYPGTTGEGSLGISTNSFGHIYYNAANSLWGVGETEWTHTYLNNGTVIVDVIPRQDLIDSGIINESNHFQGGHDEKSIKEYVKLNPTRFKRQDPDKLEKDNIDLLEDMEKIVDKLASKGVLTNSDIDSMKLKKVKKPKESKVKDNLVVVPMVTTTSSTLPTTTTTLQGATTTTLGGTTTTLNGGTTTTLLDCPEGQIASTTSNDCVTII